MSVYVAVVEPGCEKRALAAMQERKLTAYAPMRRCWRRAAGRRMVFDQLLFPGYVFVWSDNVASDLTGVHFACHVIGLLGYGGEPRPIHSGWLERVLILQSFGAFDATLARKVDIRVGSIVRLLGGAFMGQLATVSELIGRGGTKAKVDVVAGGGHKKLVLSMKKLEAAS